MAAQESHLSQLALEDLVDTAPPWLAATGAHAETVVSTRIRLARNLAGYPFPHRASDEQLAEIVQLISENESIANFFGESGFFPLLDATGLDRRFLLERRLLTPELAKSNRPAAVFVAHDESHSLLINEEDHLRLQAIQSGLGTDSAWRAISDLDDVLNETMELAFSEEFGYLTSCPTNTGTGMRVSVFIHLPSLVLAGSLVEVVKNLSSTEFTFRGFYGEGSHPIGNVFQLSNQVTLGKTEEKVLERLTKVAEQLVRLEADAREKLLNERRRRLEDVVFRAVGILTNARYLGTVECLNLLSNIRLGMASELIDEKDYRTLNEFMVFAQPAHLEKRAGNPLSEDEREQYRARFVKEKLSLVLGQN